MCNGPSQYDVGYCPSNSTLITSTADLDNSLPPFDWNSSGYATPQSDITDSWFSDFSVGSFDGLGFDMNITQGTSPSLGEASFTPPRHHRTLDPCSDSYQDPFATRLPPFASNLPPVNTAIVQKSKLPPPLEFNFGSESIVASNTGPPPPVPSDATPLTLPQNEGHQAAKNGGVQADQSVGGHPSEHGTTNSNGTGTQQMVVPDMRRSTRVPKKSTRDELMNAIGSNPPASKKQRITPASADSEQPKSKYARDILNILLLTF